MKHFLISLLLAITVTASASANPRNDFDGDGKSDPAVFRPQGTFFNGQWYAYWYMFPSSGTCPSQWGQASGGCVRSWGIQGDKPMVADLNGNGIADLIAFRPGVTPTYYALEGSSNTSWQITDLPSPSGVLIDNADVNNDAVSDLLSYNPSTYNWKSRVWSPSNGSITISTFFDNTPSIATAPIEVVSEQFVNGAKEDPTLYLRILSGGTRYGYWCSWVDQQVGGNAYCQPKYGSMPGFAEISVAADLFGPVPGPTDYVLFNPTNADWRIVYSGSGNPPQVINWGLAQDIPLAGDFIAGDGRSELVVWRPSDGTWYVYDKDCVSCTCPSYMTPWYGGCKKQWGLPGDIPISAAGQKN